MNRNFIRLFCLLVLLIITRFSLAQTTDNRPVQVTPVLQPPFSLHFSDYSTNPQLLKVYLLLKDLTKTHIDIYLSLRLQGPGVLIQTRPDFRPAAPFSLQAGVPQILSGPELSAYFQPNALEVQGLDEAILTQGGKLPEGLYTITLEAFEWDRQRESVSNQGTSLLTVFLNYPPLLTFPARDSEVPFQNLPNVLFQWVGRNTGTVAWSGQPLYTFRLWELRDEQDPNVAAQSLIPLYEETTSQSSLVYGPALPPLQPGMRYAWQVQARDALGQDVYINQGISEVSAFTYGKPVAEPVPTDSVTVPPTTTLAQLLDPFSYPVQSIDPNSSNLTVQKLLTSSVIQNRLSDSTRIPKCNPINIDGSNCVETVQVPLPSGEAQSSLNPGDVVIINQYKVLVTQATGGAGRFSGQGLLVWNFAGATHVPVSFSNLNVVKSFNSATGGCATGGQMTSGTADAALVSQLQTIIDLASPAGPTSFSGTLDQAFDALTETAIRMENSSSPTLTDLKAVGIYTAAIQLGLTDWKTNLTAAYGPNLSATVQQVLTEIDHVIAGLSTAGQCAQSGCALDLPFLKDLAEARIEDALQLLLDQDKTVPLPKPENLAYSPISNQGVTLTWAKNPLHLSYRLAYKDQYGIERVLYPSTNQVTLKGIASNQLYAYEVTAYGDAFAVSETASSDFKLGTVCLARIDAPADRIMEGDALTLSVTTCVTQSNQPGTLVWQENGKLIGSFTSQTFRPTTTTTYKVTCTLPAQVDEPALSCSDEKTVLVDKKCSGVVATASATTLVQGDIVALRVTGCQQDISWKEGYPVGTSIGAQPALITSPKLTTVYTVTCRDQTGKTCITSAGQVTVKPNCNNFQLAANSISSAKRKDTEVLIKAIGCSGKVNWEKLRGNANLNLDIINETTLNVSNIKFSFIIKATCSTTGCVVTGDYPAPPYAGFLDNSVPYCSYQHVNLKLANENSTSLTLQLVNTSQNILSGFTWDDNPGNTETRRSFNRPKAPTVFSATYQSGKCKVSYIYQPQPTGSESIAVPCFDFTLSPASTRIEIPYSASSKALMLTANGCTNGLAAGSVAWKIVDGSKETPLGTNTTGQLTYTFTDQQVNKTLTISANCALTGETKTAKITVAKGLPPGFEAAPVDPCNFYVTSKDYENFFFFNEQALNPIEFTITGGNQIVLFPLNGGPGIRSQTKDNTGNTLFTLGLAAAPGTYVYRIQNTSKEGVICSALAYFTVGYSRYPQPVDAPGPNIPAYAKQKQPSYDCATIYQLKPRFGEFGIPHNDPQRAISYVSSTTNKGMGIFAVGYSFPTDRDPLSIGLVDKVCANTPRATLKFYTSSARTKEVEVGALAASPLQHVAVPFNALDGVKHYFGRCTFVDGTYCDSEIVIDPGMAPGGRLGANDDPVANSDSSASGSVGAAVADKPCVYSKQEAVKILLTNVLCDKLSIIKGTEKQQLEILQAELQQLGLDLPSVTDAMVADLVAGKCADVVAALTKDLTGNAKVDTLNQLVNHQNADELISKVLEQTVPICPADGAPISLEEDIPSGGRLSYAVDPNRLFIAPDGRAVKLPTGARPKFFNFGGSWGASPVGTLQGFETSDGTQYFADISAGSQSFLGYRRVSPLCPASYYGPTLYANVNPNQPTPVYYFQTYEKDERCGYNWIEGTHTFVPTAGRITTISSVTGPWTTQTPFKKCVESTDYISKGAVNFYKLTNDLTASEKAQLQNLLAGINTKLGGFIGGEGSITCIDVSKADWNAIKEEARKKGVEEFIPQAGRLQYDNKYVLIFFGIGAGMTDCQYRFIRERMNGLQKSSFFNYDYTGLDSWATTYYQLSTGEQQSIEGQIATGQSPSGLNGSERSKFSKTMLSTGAFYYYAAFSALACTVAEEKFADTSRTSCGEAFAAGFLHSVLETVDIVTLLVGGSELAKAAANGTAQIWMDYPQNLRDFQTRLAANPQEITGSDLVKVLPPPMQSEANNLKVVGNVVSFLYKYYGEEGSCWRSGDLAFQVLPILLSGGVMAAKTLAPKLATLATFNGKLTRLGKIFQTSGLLSEEQLAQQFIDGATVEYAELGTIKETILKDSNGEVLKVYDELNEVVEDVGKISNHDPETVFHVKSDQFVQNVLDAIDPDFFVRKNRYANGFYVAQKGETAIAEVVYHGADPAKSKVIRFTLDKSKLNVLDLTDPIVGESWNLSDAFNYERQMEVIGNIDDKYDKFIEIADKAVAQGYNAIKFTSQRGSGSNYVLYGDKEHFKQILSPQMVIPAIE
ncbi:fibronectin type III domain-containing protein [Larkinella rosea]|uniref:Fibronectin type-III domain-containing protein n=1 Tax=Larkinella rosea TaxID=2025312 RepID=A0A3P1BP56_9BACT|nr:fibronectin type III domain-containing protein [Larkinella rosea]RRB02839.1 hypothetical protein EHT25_20590 [Larkinella rosea]